MTQTLPREQRSTEDTTWSEEDEELLVPVTEAAARLGISRGTMARLIQEDRFPVYENPIDRRQKLVNKEEVLEAIRPGKRRIKLRTAE